MPKGTWCVELPCRVPDPHTYVYAGVISVSMDHTCIPMSRKCYRCNQGAASSEEWLSMRTCTCHGMKSARACLVGLCRGDGPRICECSGVSTWRAVFRLECNVLLQICTCDMMCLPVFTCDVLFLHERSHQLSASRTGVLCT